MNSNGKKTVVCLNWGGVYGSDYINKLYRGVARHLPPPFQFICFTDNNDGLLPQIESRDIEMLTLAPALRNDVSWKLALMHPVAELLGHCLFLDLDVMVLDDLSPFFTQEGDFFIIHNWIERRKQIFRKRPVNGNSSVFRFEAGSRPDVVENFLSDPHRAKTDFTNGQAFLTWAVGLERLQWWPEEWVRSFKYHCRPIFPLNWVVRPQVPKGTRILAFHGRPNPPEAISGCQEKWHKYTLPAPQLDEHWR